MKSPGLLFAFLDAAAFMLSASFVFYVTSILVPYLRHKPGPAGDDGAYSWHFVVPCLDEERVIEGTVRRLLDQFPDSHVWCIDDASTDDTPNILRRLSGADRRCHVVTRVLPDARVGKGPALNAAWAAINNWLDPDTDPSLVILGVVDADGQLDPECLRIVSGERYFGNPKISGVQVQVRVRNTQHSPGARGWSERLLVRMQDMEFTSVIAAIQMLRHNIGSVGMGGNGQFTRLSSLNRIAERYGSPWKKALIEDFELGLHILLSGGHNEYCHETWVLQQGPARFWKLARQRSRWGQGVMQCWHYWKPIMRSPNIPTAAAIEIVYFMMLPWMQVIGDLIYLLAAGGLLYVAFESHGGLGAWLAQSGGWQVVPVFAIFGVGPFFIWGPVYRRRIAPELTRMQAIGLGLANWPYLLVHHCAAWWAFSRVIRSRHDWQKTERVDERPTLAPALALALTSGSVLARFELRPPSQRPVAKARLRLDGQGANPAAAEPLRLRTVRFRIDNFDPFDNVDALEPGETEKVPA